MTSDQILKMVGNFIQKRNITDEDLIQDLYVIAFECNKCKTNNNIYQKIFSKLEKRCNQYDKEHDNENLLFLNDILNESVEYDLDSSLFNEEMNEELWNQLNELDERERGVLVHRFGLDNDGAKTLEKCSKIFNVGSERIRQIEAKALRKLRHPSRCKKLRSFLFIDEAGKIKVNKRKNINIVQNHNDKQKSDTILKNDSVINQNRESNNDSQYGYIYPNLKEFVLYDSRKNVQYYNNKYFEMIVMDCRKKYGIFFNNHDGYECRTFFKGELIHYSAKIVEYNKITYCENLLGVKHMTTFIYSMIGGKIDYNNYIYITNESDKIIFKYFSNGKYEDYNYSQLEYTFYMNYFVDMFSKIPNIDSIIEDSDNSLKITKLDSSGNKLVELNSSYVFPYDYNITGYDNDSVVFCNKSFYVDDSISKELFTYNDSRLNIKYEKVLSDNEILNYKIYKDNTQVFELEKRVKIFNPVQPYKLYHFDEKSELNEVDYSNGKFYIRDKFGIPFLPNNNS